MKKTPTSNKKIFLTLAKKLEIIEMHERGFKYSKIASDYKMPQSSVRTICDKKEKYKLQATVTNPKTATIVRFRTPTMDKMENLLSLWICDLEQRGIPCSRSVIQTKAVSLFEHIKKNAKEEDLHERKRKKPFIASNGWFERFKRRQEIESVKLCGESKSADHDAAEKYPPKLKEIIRLGNYSEQQIFNGVSFTSVFLIHLLVLLGLNWAGSDRLKVSHV